MNDSDWRLQNQEKYLKGAALSFKPYNIYRENWDHDHCEFCGAKFMLSGADFNEGYTTADNYYWICAPCFEDFKTMFEWSVVPIDTKDSEK